MNTKVTAVCAVSYGRVIGCNGSLPWHIPDDLKNFKRITLGKTVVMGRNTFLSIGRPLSGRTNVVISSRGNLGCSGISECRSWEEAVLRHGKEKELVVIGGAKLIESVFPYISEQFLTLIQHGFLGDAYYPEFDPLEWNLKERMHHDVSSGSPYAWDFIHLIKKNNI